RGADGRSDLAGVGAVLRGYGEEYTAGYLDTPAGRGGLSDDHLLDDGVARVVGDPGRRKVSERPIEVNGFPGREVVAEADGKGTVVARLVVAGGREYCLAVAGRSVGPDGERTRRFLDSVAITDPRRLAVPEERRQAALRQAAADEAERERRLDEARRQEEARRAEQERRVLETPAEEQEHPDRLLKLRAEFFRRD